MLFKLKIDLPLGKSYEEEIDIDDNMIKEWDNNRERESRMEEYLENWLLDLIDSSWEEVEL